MDIYFYILKASLQLEIFYLHQWKLLSYSLFSEWTTVFLRLLAESNFMKLNLEHAGTRLYFLSEAMVKQS